MTFYLFKSLITGIILVITTQVAKVNIKLATAITLMPSSKVLYFNFFFLTLLVSITIFIFVFFLNFISKTIKS